MKTNKRIALTVAAISVFAGMTLSLFGNGFGLPDQDAFATGRGEAVVATADNPSAIYYNPAGIAQLQGNNVRAGFYGIYLDPSYTPQFGTHTYHNDAKLHEAGHLYYTYGKDEWPVVLGLGIYAPFGLGVEWPQNTGFRTIATRAELLYSTINPVLAIKLGPTFMIGGGVMVNYANADIRQGLFSPVVPVDGFRFAGEGWGAGYNLGALWQPYEMLSFGVTFRSGATIDLRGHTEAYNFAPPFPSFEQRVAATADLPVPLQAVFGVSYRPSSDWNLEFDANYTGWNAVDTILINQPASFALPRSIPLVLNWQSSWLFEFGATKYFPSGWHVSAGYVLNENAMPDARFNPLVADLDRHFFSLGTGYKGSVFNFDVAYQFGYGPSRNVNGSAPSLAGQNADGRYDYISHALLITVGMHF